MLTRITAISILLVLLCFAASEAAGQKRNAAKRKTTAVKAQPPTPAPSPASEVAENTEEPIPAKRNDRPKSDGSADGPSAPIQEKAKAEYEYLFFQPNFTLSRVLVRHNDLGKGTVEFLRSDQDDPVTEPIELSATTLARINANLDELRFLESNESYQHEKDFSHLGTVRITFSRDEKKRTAEFNWTDNQLARSLAGEYRKIANQFIWQFDMTLARENQPLESPKLIARLETYLKRNEISDPVQMLPLLNELANDERLPLIARNHALRLIEQIKKKAK
jgi:hypothetical protein